MNLSTCDLLGAAQTGCNLTGGKKLGKNYLVTTNMSVYFNHQPAIYSSIYAYGSFFSEHPIQVR